MIRSTRLPRAALSGLLISSFLVLSAQAAGIGTGTVNVSALRLRKGAGTANPILTTAAKGENVVILEKADDNWYKVEYREVEGYMSGEYLDLELAPAPQTKAAANQADASDDQGEPADSQAADAQTADAQTDDAQKADSNDAGGDETGGDEEGPLYGKVNTEGSVLNVRSGPDTSYDRLFTLPDNVVVEITDTVDGWYQINYGTRTGYVSAEYMVLTDAPAPLPEGYDQDLGLQVVDYARTFLGKPYVFGATGPNSFDCSGLTYYVYKHFGYTLRRGGSGQYLYNGVSVARSALQPGDLVFFRNDGETMPMSHVGIYIGDNQFLHADSVSLKVKISPMTGFYDRTYVGARRII